MKNYIDLVLKKEKKPIDIEKLYQKIESILKKENGDDYLLSSSEKEEINHILSDGLEKVKYYKTPTGKYTLLSKTSFRKGRFHGNRAGEGFVTVITSYIDKEGKSIVREEKYSIVRDNCNSAIDGDMVLIDIGGNGQKPKIEKILDRNVNNVIGEIVRLGNSFFVKPIDKKKQALTIALDGDGYIEGQIVSVALEEMRSDNFYVGTIIREFQHKDDPHEDALLEAFKCGMPEGFSEESLQQLEYIPTTVSENDKVGRYDFTNWEIFSIDGADTKDKDDCISLSKLPNGNLLLGVHIADVPFYVPYQSPIDKDAFCKGTSYYFGGCVEPQLPRKLSNGICSLNDGVERITKSILIEFSPNGTVVSRSLVPSVIKSRVGMTYEKVNDLLKNGIVDDEYKPYEATLREMARLAKILRKRRIQNGAIEFDRPEVKFLHDENGVATGVTCRHQDVSENLIEEFMLAANVNVGEILTENGIPCVYRIHDTPNIERLDEYLHLLDIIGIPFEFSSEDICKDKKLLQCLTKHIDQGGHLQSMLSTNLVKCMSHAAYSPKNIGHYGTGFGTYCHFTSPIRRLADLAVSRIIDECYFEKDENKKRKAIHKWSELSQEFATQATKMEKVEDDVEKSVNYLDTAVFMQQHVGEEFEGTVISVSGNGLTIQLDNLLEGHVRVRNLPGHYIYNPDTFTLLSMDGFSDYYIGDRLRLKLERADKDTKAVDFSVMEKIKENPISGYEASNQYVKNKAREDRYH